jgi:DNA replication protein DnaC
MKNLSLQSAAPALSADSKRFNKIQCKSCNKEWQQETRSCITGSYSGECTDCARIRRTEKFSKICPPLYQKTEVDRLPANQLTKALQWQYGPRGLILLGETGKGKSRVAWTLLKRVLTEDRERDFMWFDSISFGHQIALHYRSEDAEVWLDKVAECPILFFDDLGKLKLTERAEVELFGLIERRCASELPLIVTTNDTGDSLAARMTDNRGPAMIRRLREFCDPIQF